VRREGDLNPRSNECQIAVFETAALGHYAIPPILYHSPGQGNPEGINNFSL
jgi:hypothetical protein